MTILTSRHEQHLDKLPSSSLEVYRPLSEQMYFSLEARARCTYVIGICSEQYIVSWNLLRRKLNFHTMHDAEFCFDAEHGDIHAFLRDSPENESSLDKMVDQPLLSAGDC